MGRLILGILAGVVTFAVILGVIEFLAHQLSPPQDSAATLAIVAGAYFLGSAAGGVVAGRITRRDWAPWFIALLVLAGAVWALLEMPHPLWMQGASVLAPIAGGFAARAFLRRQTAAPAAVAADRTA